MEEKIDIDIKIKITIRDGKKILANANVYFETVAFGFVTIKNFVIWSSQKNNERLHAFANIEPPAYPAFGKYHSLAFFESATKWEILEKLIWTEYLKVRGTTDFVTPF